jgi:hypothetical protein
MNNLICILKRLKTDYLNALLRNNDHKVLEVLNENPQTLANVLNCFNSNDRNTMFTNKGTLETFTKATRNGNIWFLVDMLRSFSVEALNMIFTDHSDVLADLKENPT